MNSKSVIIPKDAQRIDEYTGYTGESIIVYAKRTLLDIERYVPKYKSMIIESFIESDTFSIFRDLANWSVIDMAIDYVRKNACIVKVGGAYYLELSPGGNQYNWKIKMENVARWEQVMVHGVLDKQRFAGARKEVTFTSYLKRISSRHAVFF